MGVGHFRTQGRLSALYQVRSAMFLDAELAPTTTDERSLAMKHWPHCQADDLIVYDTNNSIVENLDLTRDVHTIIAIL